MKTLSGFVCIHEELSGTKLKSAAAWMIFAFGMGGAREKAKRLGCHIVWVLSPSPSQGVVDRSVLVLLTSSLDTYLPFLPKKGSDPDVRTLLPLYQVVGPLFRAPFVFFRLKPLS